MRKTEVRRHGEARKTILKGVNEIYDTVRLTLGPEYGTALIYRSFNRGSRITNDGVTIAECIEPKDEFENLVATAFKEAAKKTGQRAGDGTTSTIVLAGKLINDAFSSLKDDSGIQIRGMENSKVGTISLKKHLLASIPKIKEKIAERTQKIKTQEELENIADVSMGGNREVAKIVSEMVWKTGENGFITMADGFKGIIETEIIEGARFPMKISAPVFLNNPSKFEMVAEECDVIVTNYGIDSLKDFADFWNVIKRNKLIIFAPTFSDEVLVQMVKLISPKPLPNGGMVPSGIQIFPVKCPSLRTDQLDDLAVFCGARFIDKNKGDVLKNIKDFDLGFLDKAIIKSVEGKEDAILLGGKGGKEGKVGDRIEVLKGQLFETKMPEHQGLVKKRIASLASAGGVIRVGAPTDAEALPLKHKIDDAVFACQMALKFGFVKGGGLCLKEIADELYKDDILIHSALCAPYNQIQENVGSELKIEDNIIDPAKVVELEVEHGFGVAANLITCKAIIPEFDERDPRDTYKPIADAMMIYNKLWAKKEGLFQSGLSEAEAERLQKQEFLLNKEN